jgi:hypothetical protein
VHWGRINKADDVVRRTTAYVRTASGVLAFSGLMLSFGQSILEVAKEKNIENLLTTLPLGADFLVAAGPLAEKAVKASFTGVTLPVDSAIDTVLGQRRLFSVMLPDKTESVRSSKDVFTRLLAAGASDQFVSALFHEDSAGWLNRVRFCDPLEAGRMMDAAVRREQRTTFASDYLGWTEVERARDFSFANAFSVPGETRREKELGGELLGRDHRKRHDVLQLANVQIEVGQRYGEWSNEQLLRLVFHNREGGAAYATLDLGALSIRPLPSPEAVYAYESRVETCRKVSDESVQPTPALIPAPEPAVVRTSAPAGAVSPTPTRRAAPAPSRPTAGGGQGATRRQQ